MVVLEWMNQLYVSTTLSPSRAAKQRVLTSNTIVEAGEVVVMLSEVYTVDSEEELEG